jgi:signal transduction histidine kinase
MWAGLTFSVTLGVRTIGVLMAGTIDDLYAPSWHQGIMVIGQFIAITLSNIAFLRIFLEIAESKKLALAHELIISNERADAMRLSSVKLKKLLDEREEIIRQLSIFNKTAGMGALVASLAHELNQPLTVIQMNTDMIDLVINKQSVKLNENTNIQNAMDGLKKAKQRAATIIQTLRNMFRNGNRIVSTFNFNDLVNEVVLISSSTMQRHQIAINVQLYAGPLLITGDKSQLQQVILNLITNASEAFTHELSVQKKIDIKTDLCVDYLELTVTDNGSGISPEIKSTIFELLRTNKDSGMGIGLWLSKTIVESHQGSIIFNTAINSGTCFTVRLPLKKEDVFF